MKGNRVLRKTALYFIGNLSSKLLVAILIPIYAFSVKPDELGYFDYTQTIMNILVPIIFLAIWESILKFLLTKEKKYSKEEIIASSLFWTIGVIIVYTIISFILNYFNIIEIKYYILVILMMIFYALAQIFQYYARALEENSTYVLSSILGTIVNFLLVILLVTVLKLGIKGLYYSYIVGQFVIVLIIEIKLKIRKYLINKSFNKKLLIEMIKFSSPLVLNIISAWLVSGYGKLIINQQLGEVANGLYSFASKFPLIITNLGSIIAMAVTEEAIINSSDENFEEDFQNTMNTLLKIFMSVIIMAVPLIFIVFEFFKTTQYYEAKNYIIPLMLYAFATTMSTNVGSVFQACNKTKFQFITTAIGGIICFVMSSLFVKEGGIQIVVISQTIGMIITLIMRYIFAWKLVKIHINVKFLLVCFTWFVIISLFSMIGDLWLVVLMFIISLLIAAKINKQIIKKIITKVKDRVMKVGI